MSEQIVLSGNGLTLQVVKTKYRESEWAVVYASTDVAGSGLTRKQAIMAARAVIASGASNIREMRSAAAAR